MLHVALDALEIERLFALLAGWIVPDDDLDVLVPAFFRHPPPVEAVDAAEVPRRNLPDLDWRQALGARQTLEVFDIDGPQRERPVDRLGRDVPLRGIRATRNRPLPGSHR